MAPRPRPIRGSPGVLRSLSYPEAPAWEILDRTARNYPERVATIYRGAGTTYREYRDLSDRFAATLAGMGVSRGDRVALLLPNSPAFILSFFAVLKTGAVAVPMNPLLREREVAGLLSDSGAETLVTTEGLRRAAPAGGLRTVLVAEDRVPGSEAPPPHPPISPKEDLGALLYTGGTTGEPKGCMITHFNLVANVVQRAAWVRVEEAGETTLRISPWSHAAGLVSALLGDLWTAATVVIFPPRTGGLDPEQVLRTVEEHRVTNLAGTPQFFIALLARPDLGRYDLSSVRRCQCGAAPASAELLNRMKERFAPSIIHGYGLTEATAAVTATPPELERVGSVGLPLPDTDVGIMDPERGAAELPPGEVGEIAIRGPQVAKGYWNRPEETARVFRDGWLFTGDLGTVDADGFVHIVDRKKDVIIARGYKVYPRELEEVLSGHPAVQQCAVVGVADPARGEVPRAHVVLRPGAPATGEELLRFCDERLAPYKRIRKIVFVESLPMTHVLKVAKRELRK